MRPAAPSRSRLTRPPRPTSSRRTAGAWSFVASSGETRVTSIDAASDSSTAQVFHEARRRWAGNVTLTTGRRPRVDGRHANAPHPHAPGRAGCGRHRAGRPLAHGRRHHERLPPLEADVRHVVDLGALKGNQGDQQYNIPGRVDLERYSTAVIWCRAFSVLFARAPLG